MAADADKIVKRFEALSSDRGEWEGAWQQCADYVLPRLGQHNKKADRIFDSTAPLAVGRFAAALESCLTPRTQKWNTLITGNATFDQRPDVGLYLEMVNDTLFRARYMPEANFANQMMEVYLSLGVLGTAVIFVDDELGQGLRYQCIPVHEVFVAENAVGRIDTVFRLYKLTARQAVQEFGDELPDNIKRDEGDEQRKENEYEFIHGVFPRRDGRPGRVDAGNQPIASIHVARAARKIVRESGYRTMPYAVSRFSTTTGEVYGRSPAMDVMADIVKVNAMNKTMLRAAEKMVNPPLLTPEDDILAGFNLKAGAINPGGVDSQGRQLVVPLQINGNLPIGLEMIDQARTVINEAFYLNLFQVLVERTGQQTATEVVERAQEKAQLLAPTMGRQQSELLRPIIERELDIISAGGGLDYIEVPEILLESGGPAVMPKYETTMAKALDSGDGVAILQAVQGLSGLAGIDQSVVNIIDAKKAGRSVCKSFGVPARDMRDEKEVAAMEQQQKQQEQAMAAMQMGGAAVQSLQGLANAEKSLQQSQAVARGIPGGMTQ